MASAWRWKLCRRDSQFDHLHDILAGNLVTLVKDLYTGRAADEPSGRPHRSGTMINRPPPDLGDIWHDGPIAPGQAKPSPVRNAATRSRKTRVHQTRPRARRRWLAVLGYGALAIACLGTAAFAFVLVAAPVDLVRDRVIEQVKARTGRDLAIAGPAALSLFPRPAISLSDVSLSAPEGFEAPPILVVPTIEAELSLWSLLTAQPGLERITLRRPTIALSVDAEGRRSWDFTSLRPRRSRASPVADSAQPPQSTSGEAAPNTEPRQTAVLSKLGSGSIRVIDGTVRYRDDGTGSKVEIEALNVTLATDGSNAPLRIDGTLAVRGQALTVAATVSPVGALLADQPAQLAIKVSGAPFDGAYKGSLALAAGISLDGTLKLQAPSAQALGGWLGRPLPASGDADAVAFSADLKVTPAKVALSRLQANFGAATMAGALALETKQQRQHLSGSLDVSELDFGRLLTRPRSIARTQAQSAPAPSPRSSEPPATTSAGPPADKEGRSRGWSDDPIDLALLGQIDANLTLSAGRLVYKELTTGPGRLSVAVDGGLGRMTLEDIELYGGRASGLLTLDASGGVPVASSQIILKRVALHPFLTAALQFPWLDGSGNMYMELAGQGLTERQMVESLNGKVEVSAAEGAVVGIDVGKILRNLQRGRLPSLAPSSDEKTPFSELVSTFAIINGIATNKDLKLVSPHVQLDGEGTLDLGQRQIDYTVRTKLGGTPDPDATIRVGSLEVPIAITGSWDKPDFGIKGQEQLTDTLKQVRKNLKSQDVRDAIKGLLQGDGEKRVKPRDLIDKLLKKD
jgi:AsmA protein